MRDDPTPSSPVRENTILLFFGLGMICFIVSASMGTANQLAFHNYLAQTNAAHPFVTHWNIGKVVLAMVLLAVIGIVLVSVTGPMGLVIGGGIGLALTKGIVATIFALIGGCVSLLFAQEKVPAPVPPEALTHPSLPFPPWLIAFLNVAAFFCLVTAGVLAWKFYQQHKLARSLAADR